MQAMQCSATYLAELAELFSQVAVGGSNLVAAKICHLLSFREFQLAHSLTS